VYVHILKAFGLASLVFLSTVHKCACSVFVDERVSCHLAALFVLLVHLSERCF
jgi:hypothetical protein